MALYNFKNIDVHGFCDSSGEAYASCIYIFCRCCHGVMVNLVASKCWLVPSKSKTISRLELLSRLLLSKLLVSVLDVISQLVTVSSIFCWCDSMVVDKIGLKNLEYLGTEQGKCHSSKFITRHLVSYFILIKSSRCFNSFHILSSFGFTALVSWSAVHM